MDHLATLNFSLGEDIDMLRDTVNRFAAIEIAPRAAAIDEENFRHDLWRKLGDLGVLGPTLGGNGYINEYPTGRLWRDAKLYEIGAGTSEIRRMLIGRELFAETA